MPYAVWVRKCEEVGLTKYKVDGLPEFPCNVAVKITEEQLLVAKYLHGVTTFAEVQGATIDESDERDIVFEDKRYHVKNGVFTPPIDDKIYERMKEQGIL